MSRWLDRLPDGIYRVDVYDWEGCRYLHNEVCCNANCDMCCDFPDPEEDCKKCQYFEQEEKNDEL